MLEREFKYYLANQPSLIKKYKGKWIVIKNNKVIGVYTSELEALNTSTKENELGTFLIQFVYPTENGNKQTFHSRVRV